MGAFTLWQLPAQTPHQMNSFVIRSSHGKVIVIDGGYKQDAGYLKGFLAALGNRVECWFITHQHLDHVDALTEILNHPGDLHIEGIHGSLHPEAWVAEHEGSQLDSTVQLNEALRVARREVADMELGQMLQIDEVSFEVLGIRNPEITVNAINNSSVVMRVHDEVRSILFPADLGVEGGRKLLAGPHHNRLKSDYVQMAHHGQNGVEEEFYQAVGASICIWPTPRWLWDNDSGSGQGSGKWKTLEVRAWMEKLGVRQHYRLFDGLQEIR
ncbi:MAG: MBL fold metallo-hydrolase [Gemmatimonadetes bacterium]|jgi:beta-lactamase superfamily II metal-dependent hydrolase|nr:MBL fold metallo-hydrolase [Gemmatimonadota bacterium]